MWIDAHHHLWDPSVRAQTWMDSTWPINRPFDTADLRAAIEGTPVQATIVVQTEPSLYETAEMLEVAAADPVINGVVGWIDLHDDINHQLDDLATSHGDELLVGVRHQAEAEPDPRWLSADAVVQSVRSLGRRGLAYDLLVKPHQLPSAIDLAEATQDTTRLVLNHCAKPLIGSDLTGWARSIRALASFDNVACKLSGLVTEANWTTWTSADLMPIADVILECFGPNRTMFGSDWPVCLLAATYREVADAAATITNGLSSTERSQVFAGTARGWYSLI
ncbi:MAG: amidohydrolase family protein [bacterium]|nr:amidohydrolase family protein [bacterium]MDE0234562.1 amidohydrolase family protein [bacterium]